MVNIKLEHVSKSYGKTVALDDVTLEIHDKEYFIVLGPTGAGKTTLLKIIAGLIKPDEGRIYFDGEDVTDLPANKRNLGFVFENYALFRHMTVLENICYSGRVKDRDPEMTRALADQILMMTLLKGRNDAVPPELSGGMQQRVALSRSLMNLEKTGLILLDEPLKALDAGLRMSLRKEIRDMAKSEYLELTAIHVTNEMEEAMMVADRIAVQDGAEIIQVGTPYEIYFRPKNLFVANFFSEINLFECKYVPSKKPGWNYTKNPTISLDFLSEHLKEENIAILDLKAKSLFAVYLKSLSAEDLKDGETVMLVVRANHMKIRLGNRTDEKHNSFLGKITRRKFMGVDYRFEVKVELNGVEKIIVVTIPATYEIHDRYQVGAEVTVYFPRELGIVFKHIGEDHIKQIMNYE